MLYIPEKDYSAALGRTKQQVYKQAKREVFIGKQKHSAMFFGIQKDVQMNHLGYL